MEETKGSKQRKNVPLAPLHILKPKACGHLKSSGRGKFSKSNLKEQIKGGIMKLLNSAIFGIGSRRERASSSIC